MLEDWVSLSIMDPKMWASKELRGRTRRREDPPPTPLRLEVIRVEVVVVVVVVVEVVYKGRGKTTAAGAAVAAAARVVAVAVGVAWVRRGLPSAPLKSVELPQATCLVMTGEVGVRGEERVWVRPAEVLVPIKLDM